MRIESLRGEGGWDLLAAEECWQSRLPSIPGKQGGGVKKSTVEKGKVSSLGHLKKLARVAKGRNA